MIYHGLLAYLALIMAVSLTLVALFFILKWWESRKNQARKCGNCIYFVSETSKCKHPTNQYLSVGTLTKEYGSWRACREIDCINGKFWKRDYSKPSKV